MKIAIVLMATLAAAGCANKPPIDVYGQCIDAIAANPKYKPIAEKIALGRVSAQTIAMLSDETKISENDKPLLLSWTNEKNDCAQQDSAGRARMHPKVRQLVELTESIGSAAAADLYSGKITYGEFAKRRKAGYDAFRSDIADLQSEEIASGEANKRQVLLMQMQALQNKPAPAPAPQPYMIPTRPTVTTNCTTVAGQVNCVSR